MSILCYQHGDGGGRICIPSLSSAGCHWPGSNCCLLETMPRKRQQAQIVLIMAIPRAIATLGQVECEGVGSPARKIDNRECAKRNDLPKTVERAEECDLYHFISPVGFNLPWS